MIVVTNSTPIISLAKIDKLHLLRDIFGKIYVPNAVYKEVVLKGKGRPGSKEIEEAEWVASKEVYNITSKKHLLAYLDEGEAEVILLAELRNFELSLVPSAERPNNTLPFSTSNSNERSSPSP